MVSQWGQIPVEAMIAWGTSTVVEILGIGIVVASFLFLKPTGE
jgi:hypothetical protein